MYKGQFGEVPAPLIEIVEKPETRTQPELRRSNIGHTRNYAEDTSIIHLSTLPLEVMVIIMPLGDERKFKELLETGKDRRTHLFMGVTSSYLKNLFQAATKEIAGNIFQIVEQDVFRADYKIIFGREIYAAAEKLNETYDR